MNKVRAPRRNFDAAIGIGIWVMPAALYFAYHVWTSPSELEQIRINIGILEAEQRKVAADTIRQHADCVADRVEFGDSTGAFCESTLPLKDQLAGQVSSGLQRRIDEERARAVALEAKQR